MVIQTANYNVTLYDECNIDSDKSKYHLLDIAKFDGDTLIKQNFLYVIDSAYWDMISYLDNETVLDELINKPKNKKVLALAKRIDIVYV